MKDWSTITGKEATGYHIADNCARYAVGFYEAKSKLADLCAYCDRNGIQYEKHEYYYHFYAECYGNANNLYICLKAFKEEFNCASMNEAIARVQKAVNILLSYDADPDSMFGLTFHHECDSIDISTAGSLAPSVIRQYLADMEELKQARLQAREAH